MRKFFFYVAATISLIALTDCNNTASSASDEKADTISIVTAEQDSAAISDINSDADTADPENIEIIPDEHEELCISPVMTAGRHSFGYRGDISDWGGWYFDNTRVGDDFLLKYDSVGPSSLKLDLVTRQLTVDLLSPSAPKKIRQFIGPIDGFKRFSRKQTVCIDTADMGEYGIAKIIGYFSLVTDFTESHEKADMINQHVCRLACESGISGMKVPSLSSLSSSQSGDSRYSGLSDYILKKTVKAWRGPDGPDFIGSGALDIGVRAHIVNPAFVTFAVSQYERAGIGHGGITENFRTLDLSTGKGLSNKDIFLQDSHDKVVQLLYDTIAKDPRYTKNRSKDITGDAILKMKKQWDDSDPLPEGGLTDTGVVFSFQPYEIDSWAAGTYHFIVPYDKLEPYLTPRVGKLISSSK